MAYMTSKILTSTSASWLARLSQSHGGVDHVTWRRALVDFGYLRRATDGAIYVIRGERIDAELSADARAVDPAAVFAEVTHRQDERRSRFE